MFLKCFFLPIFIIMLFVDMFLIKERVGLENHSVISISQCHPLHRRLFCICCLSNMLGAMIVTVPAELSQVDDLLTSDIWSSFVNHRDWIEPHYS